ncbi:AT-hook motif nuclear-localized protein 6-like [Brassica rapa]|uniref:AT-hook motif nuclear-localized protein n=1 Tax=Brassica campestris TaxID=3711 RepID=M4EKF4_BRACM|nr:AT-hook motif nuclear-localized protein 6-like [Brassica rapa]
MEEKGGVSPSGVITVKGDEEATEFQQNPSLLQPVGPTTVVSRTPSPPPSPPPPPPPTSVTPVSAAAAPPPLISSAGLDLTKKKRGRPRKYAPDGSLNPRYLRPTLSPTPISTSIPFSGDYSHWKQGKAQQYLPVELIKKPHMFEYGSSPAFPPPPGLSCYVDANFTTHQFTVNAGEDVMMKAMPYSQGSRTICILSATGSISNVTLRQAAISGGTLTYEGWFEILSLSGSFMPTEQGGTKGWSGGMSISLAGPNGKIIGGGLAGMLIAASPVQVIMGSFIVINQAEQTQNKKPRIMEASPPPQQQQHPTFNITNVNSTSPVVATIDDPKQQTDGGGGMMRPVAQTPFHNDNSAMNNFTTTNHGYGNVNTSTNKEEADYADGGDDDQPDDDSCDTRSLSNGD